MLEGLKLQNIELNLSNEAFDQLDRLDGNFDSKLSDSIFNQAKEMLEEAKSVNNIQMLEIFINKIKGSKVGKILMNELVKIINNIPQIQEIKMQGLQRMSYIADAADRYIKQNGSPAGFSIENIPIGIKSVKLQKCPAENTSAKDDVVTFDANGNGVIQRKDDEQVKYRLCWEWIDGTKYDCSVPFYKNDI